MKPCKHIALTVASLAICAALGMAIAATPTITNQQRHGATLIVTYSDGSVKTNSLFLAMSPVVKRELARIEAETIMVKTLGAVVTDTRANIPETATLSDTTIAMLYLSQMSKDADALKTHAPTNTLEYLIGTGMRQDLATQTGDAHND